VIANPVPSGFHHAVVGFPSLQNASHSHDDNTISHTLDTGPCCLPRDSRDVYFLPYLNPESRKAPSPVPFNFLGSQSYGSNFSLDGQRANGGSFGDHTRPTVSRAVGESNVMSNDFTRNLQESRTSHQHEARRSHLSRVLFYNNKNSALAVMDPANKDSASLVRPDCVQANIDPTFNINDVWRSFGGDPFRFEKHLVPLRPMTELLPFRQPLLCPIPCAPLPVDRQLYSVSDSAKPQCPRRFHVTPVEVATDNRWGLGQHSRRFQRGLLEPHGSETHQCQKKKKKKKYFPHIRPVRSHQSEERPEIQVRDAAPDTPPGQRNHAHRP